MRAFASTLGAAACLLALGATQAFGAWSQTIDDNDANFSEFHGGDLQVAVDSSAYGGTYHYVNDWGDSNESKSATVKYQLTGVPAGNHLYHISISSPADSKFGTEGSIAQWHILNVAADGTEDFVQRIPWAGQFMTNRQWLGPNSGYKPGDFTQLGPGPQNDASLGDGSLVWLNGSGPGQPYIIIGYQPFYTSPIAFDAVTVTKIQEINPDTNHDGLVDISDIQTVAANWLNTGPSFLTGDANDDSIVDISDIQTIASHWLETWPPGGGSAGSSVPEPASVLLLVIGIAACPLCTVVRRRTARGK